MLARVTFLELKRPFRKMYLPSVSILESVTWKGRSPATNIETPLDLASGFVAWYASTYRLLYIEGIELVRKWVS